jgi:nucleoid-associated protein YgaU
MKDAGRQRVRQRILGFGTWCVALLVGTALFHALGDGRLAPPPLDPSAWVPWIEDRDALIATMALLRLVVLGLCWYLVGVTTVGTIARLLRAARLTRIADALTLPIVRRLLQQTLGVVLATAMVTAATGPSLTVPPAPVQVAADVGDDHGRAGPAAETPGSGSEVRSPAPHRTGVGIARGAPSPAEGPPEVTLRGLPVPDGAEGATLRGLPVPDEAEGATLRGLPVPGAEVAPLPWRIAASDTPPRRDGVVDTNVSETAGGATRTDRIAHTVRSGESLWRIASHRLETALQRSPTDAEIVPYWRAVIELNRDRLPDRDDPDLILPGQELLLPPVAVP